MERRPEPELMDDLAQAAAYAQADFEQPHAMFMEHLAECLGETDPIGRALDLGCGAGDITARFALRYPEIRVDALDGAARMLEHARIRLRRAGIEARVNLLHLHLPDSTLESGVYNAVFSNSLLHHLADPLVLWHTVRSAAAPGAFVFIMDLMRPDSESAAEALVAEYAGGEPEILRRDFFHSLLAAYRVEEVRAQLRIAGLETIAVDPLSDRHYIAHGRLP